MQFNSLEKHSWQVFALYLLIKSDSFIRHTHITSKLSFNAPTTLDGSYISFHSVAQKLGGSTDFQDSLDPSAPNTDRFMQQKHHCIFKKARSDCIFRGKVD